MMRDSVQCQSSFTHCCVEAHVLPPQKIIIVTKKQTKKSQNDILSHNYKMKSQHYDLEIHNYDIKKFKL